MRALVCTFAEADLDKVLQAMRFVPYDRLVLIGDEGSMNSEAFRQLDSMEAMSGHEVDYRVIEAEDFMGLVDLVSEVLTELAKDPRGGRNGVAVNISAGPKLLGDAALFAAFRTGAEAYHCDSKVTRLPVLKGATAKDRFTPLQTRFLKSVIGWSQIDQLADRLGDLSRQSVERLMRELRRSGLIDAELRSGKVWVSLTDQGKEVVRALGAAKSVDDSARS